MLQQNGWNLLKCISALMQLLCTKSVYVSTHSDVKMSYQKYSNLWTMKCLILIIKQKWLRLSIIKELLNANWNQKWILVQFGTKHL